MYSKFHPPRILFCFLGFILRNQRSGTLFKGELKAIPPRSLLLLFFVFITRVSRSREFIAVTWRGVKPRTPCFVSEMIHMLPRELARQKKAGGLGGGAAPPICIAVTWRGAKPRTPCFVLFCFVLFCFVLFCFGHDSYASTRVCPA